MLFSLQIDIKIIKNQKGFFEKQTFKIESS